MTKRKSIATLDEERFVSQDAYPDNDNGDDVSEEDAEREADDLDQAGYMDDIAPEDAGGEDTETVAEVLEINPLIAQAVHEATEDLAVLGDLEALFVHAHETMAQLSVQEKDGKAIRQDLRLYRKSYLERVNVLVTRALDALRDDVEVRNPSSTRSVAVRQEAVMQKVRESLVAAGASPEILEKFDESAKLSPRKASSDTPEARKARSEKWKLNNPERIAELAAQNRAAREAARNL